jgi:hypothetical protein
LENLQKSCLRLQGFVVGFKGSQVFCLHYNSMQALEVPQSASMQGYLAAEDWQSAYKVHVPLAIFLNRSCTISPFQQASLDSAAVVQAEHWPNKASFVTSIMVIWLDCRFIL